MPIVARKQTIEEIKQTLGSKEISGEDKFELLKKVLSDTTIDKHVVLDLGIKYLNNLKNPEVAKYKSDSRDIMENLHKAFQGDELYKPWVRYFDVTYKVREELRGTGPVKIFINRRLKPFKNDIRQLVQKFLFENENSKMDWRIAKKMLAVSDNLFEQDTIDIFQQEDLFKPILVEIKKALEFLLWKDPTNALASTRLVINILNKLQEHFSNEVKFVQLKDAILSSRFDKEKFKLPNTVVVGEDGGMYLLLNNLIGDSEQVIKEVTSDDYLKDKLHKKGEKQQITIGKGGFGTVRFALSLFDAKSKPGELVCIKKTKSIQGLEMTCARVIDETLKDYFTNDIADIIYAPNVFDMALVTQDVGNKHRKGYLMMEMLPQNTATKVFANPVYQKWEYQKPYLLDVFKKTLDLLDQNIAMTDLKPDNTLYDTDTRKATIIDLGGIVKIDNREEITKFNICKYSFQSTEGFSAPELQQQKGVIDIRTALAFACGKIIEDITKGSTDIKENEVKKVKNLITSLTNSNPEERSSIKDAIEKVGAIGDDSYKENIIFTHYISKIEERLKNNKSSISINEDIENLISKQDIRKLVSNKNIKNTESLYIELYTTKLDPHKYAKLETDILFSKIDNFWSGKKEVMLLLGVAGAGKSITLQLKFIEAVNNWKPGSPLPVYFNLASNIDLVKTIDSLNNELGTNLKLNDLKGAHLYIDSFDEGLGIAASRETLIRDYIKKLEKPKILISCRTDYLPGNNDYSWFMPETKQLEVCYIAPINYSMEQKLEEYVRQYVKYVDECNNDPAHDAKYYLNKINKLKIEPIIDTGFMFEIVMQSVPSIHIPLTIEKPISKQDIYDEYVKIKQSKRIAVLHERQRNKIFELLSNLNIDLNQNTQELNRLLKELAKYIAIQLHLQNEFRIKSDSELFKAFQYEKSTLFKQQALYHILKLLPLKIETKTSGSKVKVEQEVGIGFAHVIFKNYYLFEAIKDEVERSRKSEILSSHSIVKDVELIKLISEDVAYNKNLQEFLRQAIDTTKQDQLDEAVTFAANSITLLIAAQYSFSGEDLSNIAIRGANIRNGIFQYVDFSNADLTGINLTNTNIVGAKFIGTNMKNIELSIYPDLENKSPVNYVSYSPDGKYLASGSYDKTIRIWNAENPENPRLLQTLEGHSDFGICLSYSPDSKYLATGSGDTVRIWNAENDSLLQTLKVEECTNRVRCISYSPDGKYLASGSNDGTVRIWNAENPRLLRTLEGHSDIVICLSYSHDGKYLATGSGDKTVRIWNAEDGSVLCKTSEGYTGTIYCLSYSPDGKYLAVGSSDGTVTIWNSENYKLLHNLKRHTGFVECISYSPDSKYLASGSPDNTIKIWDIQSKKLLQTLAGIEYDYSLTSLSYSPDGKYLASGYDDGTVRIWNAENASLLQTLVGHSNTVICISYSPDNKYLASGSSDNTVKIWNAENASLFQTLVEHSNTVMCISYSPSGKYLASGSSDSTVKIWNAENYKLLQNLEGHTMDVKCIRYSPDSKYLASGSYDKTVRIWNAENPENAENPRLLRTLVGHSDIVICIRYSSDGKYLASGSGDKTVRIWNVENPENAENPRLLQTLVEHNDMVQCIRYSPGGEYLASGSNDGTVRIWNVKNAENPRSLQTLEGHSDIVICIRYSSDGKYLASGSYDKTVRIWNVENPENAENPRLLQTLVGHSDIVICIRYSPDDKYLASGSGDMTVRIWNAENHRLLQTLVGHSGVVQCIRYSSDGKFLASGSYDKTIRIWEEKSDPQSKEVIWYLTKEISATESPLVVEDATIEKAVISAKNQKVFEQKGAKVDNNIIDRTENKEVNSNEGNTSKKIGFKELHALLKDKLIVADEQKALKLVNVKSKSIK